MSEESETTSVLEKIEEETREEEPPKVVKKEKDPERVKAGHRLAAVGQQRKEEKMRKKVEEEMIKPKTWITIGIIIGGICVSGLWLGIPLLGSKKEDMKKEVFVEKKEDPKNKYFG